MSTQKKHEIRCPDGIRHRWQYQIDYTDDGKQVWAKVCKRCGFFLKHENAEVRYV